MTTQPWWFFWALDQCVTALTIPLRRTVHRNAPAFCLHGGAMAPPYSKKRESASGICLSRSRVPLAPLTNAGGERREICIISCKNGRFAGDFPLFSPGKGGKGRISPAFKAAIFTNLPNRREVLCEYYEKLFFLYFWVDFLGSLAYNRGRAGLIMLPECICTGGETC